MKHLLISALLLAQPLAAQTLTVVHEKRLWRDGHGKIVISETGISYVSDKKEESREWKYEDIQYFDRISRSEFVVLSYEDSRLWLGRDEAYRFRIVGGELSDEVFDQISRRLNRPLTDRVVADSLEAPYVLPAKHLHTFGGCEGELRFTPDAIYYVTDHREDARTWRLDRDVQSVWSSDPYRLQIYAYDNNRREFSRTRLYAFDLKQPLDARHYRSLKLTLYKLQTVHAPVSGERDSPQVIDFLRPRTRIEPAVPSAPRGTPQGVSTHRARVALAAEACPPGRLDAYALSASRCAPLVATIAQILRR